MSEKDPTAKTSRLMAVALVLVSGGFTLGLLGAVEVALRIMYPERVLAIAEERRRVEDLAYAFDPDYLVTLKPNVRKTFQRLPDNGGETIEWQTNADGFVGPPLRTDAAARIIVYGDSNVQARASRRENRYASRLERYLTEFVGADIEVVNGGLVGAGPDQSLLRFAGQFEKYRPDFIVFHVFADNDFGDIVRNRIFALDSSQRLARTGFGATPDQALVSRSWRLLLIPTLRQLLRPNRGSVVVADPDGLESVDGAFHSEERQEALVKSLQEETEGEYRVYREGRRRVYSHFADHYDIDVATDPTAESSRVKVALMEEVLKEVKRTAQEKGAGLLVLIQPSIIDVTSGNHPLTSAYLSRRFERYRKETMTSLIDDMCARNGIDRLNLFPVFAANEPGSLYFTAGDGHWNDAGQDLAARETARHIQATLERLSSSDNRRNVQ